MASKLVVKTLAASARPRVSILVPRAFAVRTMASSSKPPPSERASEIIESIPSSGGLVTKTGTAILGTGLIAAAISQELYVVNNETIVVVATAILFAAIAQMAREPYKQWADGQIAKLKDILDKSRSNHTQSVKDRITSVEQMKDVVSLTESLFKLSKETAELESEAFVQRQKVSLAAELKSVLDSWVRYEQQAKESEQADLVKSVIDKVMTSLKEDKTQKDILANAVAEVEALVKSKAI